MAKGSAAKAITVAKNAAKAITPIPQTGRKDARFKSPEVEAEPLQGPREAHPKILAVLFEPGKAIGMGVHIGQFERIDLRDRALTADRSVESKHRGFFTMELRGPLLVVTYRGPKGKACTAVPVVGNVRRIEFAI